MFIEFVDGPLWYFASVVFVVGVLYRIGALLAMGVKTDLSLVREGSGGGGVLGILRRFFPRSAMMTAERYQMVAGYMFHLGLFAVLFFAAPHVRFFEERILGFGWTPLPHWAFILAANFAFAGLLLVWLRRVMDPVMKFLSTKDDHIGSILTFVVMFTGCMALLESHEALRAFHLFTCELLMIYFPFSRLMHAFTFLFARSLTGQTYARRGVGV